jgi:hypothetical protein
MNINEFLSQADIEKYKSQGYSEADIMQAFKELQQESSSGQSQSNLAQSYQNAMARQQSDARNFASNTLVSGQGLNQNLIQWQLELDSILERVEHMLRGDKPKFMNGSLIFIAPENDEDRIFTDFGVSEIMRVLSMYLNRNTILSNYDEETINWKILDFGNDISDLIYLKYEMMFSIPTFEQSAKKLLAIEVMHTPEGYAVVMGEGEQVELQLLGQEHIQKIKAEQRKQSLEKRKLYPIIVRELVDCVHSAYLRALNGGERLSLHESRSVSQNETIMPGVQFNMNGQPVMRERSVLNPMRWFGGKYK